MGTALHVGILESPRRVEGVGSLSQSHFHPSACPDRLLYRGCLAPDRIHCCKDSPELTRACCDLQVRAVEKGLRATVNHNVVFLT